MVMKKGFAFHTAVSTLRYRHTFQSCLPERNFVIGKTNDNVESKDPYVCHHCPRNARPGVALDKSEGFVKGTLLLSGAMSTADSPEKVEDQGPLESHAKSFPRETSFHQPSIRPQLQP